MMIPTTVYFFITMELLAVSYLDIMTRKISNNWVFLNILVFIALLFIFPKEYSFKAETFLFSFLLLTVGLIFFKFGIMGAGDSKYLSSFYLLIPLPKQEEVFSYCIYTILIGGSFILFFNTVRNFDKIIAVLRRLEDIRILKGVYGKKRPFAPFILVSWLWYGIVYWNHIWSQIP